MYVFQGLCELDLEGCTHLEDEDVITACALLPNLEFVDLKGADRLTDVTLTTIAWKCTALTTLQVQNYTVCVVYDVQSVS